MSRFYREVAVIDNVGLSTVIKQIVIGLLCTMFSLFTHAFPAEVLEKENSLVDLIWHLPDTLKHSISFEARVLRRKLFNSGKLLTDDITITGRAGQVFVVCAEEVITDDFGPVSSVAGNDYLHVLQLATETGELTILNGKNCPDSLTRHYPYDMAQRVRSTEPFLVIKKEKPHSSFHNDDQQLLILPSNAFDPKETLFITESGTVPGFDDHNNFKRPPFMPMPDKTMANLILLPTLSLPANWREYLPFAGLYHWFVESSETQAGLTLLVQIGDQAPITLRISQAEYPEMAERLLNTRQLLHWLAPKLNGREAFVQQLMEMADVINEHLPHWDLDTLSEIQRQLMIVLDQPDTEFSLEFETRLLADSLSDFSQGASPETGIIQQPKDKTENQPDQLPADQEAQQSSENEQSAGRQPDQEDKRDQGNNGEGGRQPEEPSGTHSVRNSGEHSTEDYFTIVVNNIRFHIRKDQLSPSYRGQENASSIKAQNPEHIVESLPLTEVEAAVGIQEENRLSNTNKSPLDYLLTYGTTDTKNALQSYYSVNLISEREGQLVTDFDYRGYAVNQKCEICRDPLLSRPSLTPCNHSGHHAFHTHCLSQWFRRSQACPCCQEELPLLLSKLLSEEFKPELGQPQSFLCLLPEDELNIIFKWLPVRDQQRLSATCKILRVHYCNNAAHLILKPLEKHYFDNWTEESIEKAISWLQEQQGTFYGWLRLCEFPDFLIEACKKTPLSLVALIRYLSTIGKMAPHFSVDINLEWQDVSDSGSLPESFSTDALGEPFYTYQSPFSSHNKSGSLNHILTFLRKTYLPGALAELSDGRLSMYHSDGKLSLFNTETNDSMTDRFELIQQSGYIEPKELQLRTCMTVLPGNRLAVVRLDHAVEIWDIVANRYSATLEGHDKAIHSLAALSWYRLASGSLDGTVKVWNTNTVLCELRIQCGGRRLTALQDDRLAIIAEIPKRKSVVKIWNARTGACETVLDGHNNSVLRIAVLSGHRLASSSFDGTIKVWDFRTGVCLGTIDLPKLEGPVVVPLAVLPDGLLASISSKGTIRAWDTQTFSCKATLESGHHDAVELAVLPDGRLVSFFRGLVGWSHEDSVRIHDIKGGLSEAFRNIPRGYFFSFTVLRDGRLALCWDNGHIFIWDMYHPVKAFQAPTVRHICVGTLR